MLRTIFVASAFWYKSSENDLSKSSDVLLLVYNVQLSPSSRRHSVLSPCRGSKQRLLYFYFLAVFVDDVALWTPDGHSGNLSVLSG